MFYLKLCNYFSKLYPYFWSYKTKNTLCGIVRFLFFYIRVRASKRGSSVFWSDNNAPKLRSLMKCHTEERRVRRDIKTNTGRHGGTVGTWSDGDCLPILLAIYIQIVHTKRVIRNLYATPPLLFVPSAPPCIAFISALSVALCALLYKRFNLSLHISEEPQKRLK